MPILKADIDARAKELGLTASQVTPTLRVEIAKLMQAEAQAEIDVRGVDEAKRANDIAATWS